MEILFKTTNEITNKEWNSYISSFNTVFEKETTLNDFIHKYSNTIDNNSYHTFVIENDEVVGAFSVIPYNYFFEEEIFKVGLAVDVFILEAHRKNPMALFNMYKLLKDKIIEAGMDIIAGVPNDMAYPFWKKVLRWKDIGCLPYYALPIKLGNVLSKAKPILNPLNTFFLKLWFLGFQNASSQSNSFPIQINKDDPIVENQRYTHQHKKVMHFDIFFTYRIVNEEGINTCYLIDFYDINSKQKNKSVLKKALRYIVRLEIIDVIVYVGTLNFKPGYLVKIPFNKEPKHLYFMGNILSKDQFKEEFVFNLNNWDFGLFNYDVR